VLAATVASARTLRRLRRLTGGHEGEAAVCVRGRQGASGQLAAQELRAHAIHEAHDICSHAGRQRCQVCRERQGIITRGKGMLAWRTATPRTRHVDVPLAGAHDVHQLRRVPVQSAETRQHPEPMRLGGPGATMLGEHEPVGEDLQRRSSRVRARAWSNASRAAPVHLMTAAHWSEHEVEVLPTHVGVICRARHHRASDV